MKEGRQEDLELEAFTDKVSSSIYSSSKEETSSEGSDNSIEIMGLMLKQPGKEDMPNLGTPLEDEKQGKMLAKDFGEEEREPYLAIIRNHSSLFIIEYEHIAGVTVIEHQIHLKEQSKPITHELRRLGTVQQSALLKEVQKLLKAGLIYPVENLEWVSPVVVTPKKNGKWWVCVDYKPLNPTTKREFSRPLPR